MKIFKSVILVLATFLAFLSCQKELSFDNTGVSAGVFLKDAGGNCLPATITGVFKKDSVLTNNLFVDVQVNVSTPGTFDIRSDTINGYSFSKAGSVVFGVNTIRLYPTGTPAVVGNNTFTIKYGTSTCTFTVTVVGSNTGTAVFTLGSGTGGACTGATTGGVFTAGVQLTPANTLTVQVNVTTPGTYIITTTPSNGFSFSGTGTFTSPGVQNVTLTATGKPIAAGNTAVSVTNVASSCTFSITVLPAAPPAVFTLDGAPNACTNFVVNGTYAVNVAPNSTNSVTLNVTVQTAGTYTITTNTADGITFSKTGIFTSTGSQPVTLQATGTAPATSGPVTFSPTVASTCTFTVTVQPPPPPAVYTLSGAPGACAPITVNGSYAALSPLGTANTAVVQVNVTTAGTYTLSTNTVNGMTFSASGLFTTTGLQNVTLLGTGTPLVAETDVLTPQIGTSSCTFNVVVAAAPTGTLTCKIDGVFTSFSGNARAQISYNVFGTTETDLAIQGNAVVTLGDTYNLFVSKPNGGTIPAGVYNQDTYFSGGVYKVSMNYFNSSTSVYWAVSDNIPLISPNPPFTITITSITATRYVGTFSGTIKENFGQGTGTKSITEGVFDVPIQ